MNKQNEKIQVYGGFGMISFLILLVTCSEVHITNNNVKDLEKRIKSIQKTLKQIGETE